MSDTWGNLTEQERQAIAAGAQRLSEQEIDQRFQVHDGRVTFKIVRQTERSLAGPLDIDLDDGDASGEPAEDEVRSAVSAVEVPTVGEPDEPSPEDLRQDEVVEVTLISADDFDYDPVVSAEDQEAAKPIDDVMAEFDAYFASDRGPADTGAVATDLSSEAAGLPSVVDHRNRQSPVKNQNPRGTCVAHASMGLLEAFDHIPDDLSEQYTHFKFNDFLNRPHNVDSGLRTTDAAPFLARSDGRVCLEAEWPYIPNQSTINAMVANGTYAPPVPAVQNQSFGIGAYKIITDGGLSGESIKNTRYLEALLYKGYNIVIGTWVSWNDNDNNGVLDPVLDPSGNPIGVGGHAMVVVGYNRSQQYFIVKNSWGAGWGHAGYAYLHYDLVRSCFKYGFVVDSVVPQAPTKLPGRIARAPYSTAAISRSRLRAAVLFIRTSQGRFAVCEAYAGTNLHLRNLRVYNADGSTHLERDSLVVRGTYLCDVDSARETTDDADFWWRAVRPGVNYLVPRNGAAAYVAFDLAALGSAQVAATPLTSAPVPERDLDYAVIVGRTTANRPFKLLAHAREDNSLRISYLEVFNQNGSRFKYATNVTVPSSWTYNLDTLSQGGGQYADIWWHVISSGVGFLERYSHAQTGLVWNL